MMMLTLGPETKKDLDALTAKAGQTREEYIGDLIADHLEDLEAIRDYEGRVRNGMLKTSTLEVVSRRLGLDD